MNHLLIKGLLSLLMIGQAPVEPVCIAIDKYQTPDKEFNIYFFGDLHIGGQKALVQEHADFISAAKKKNAFVIGEDALHYTGNDQAIKQWFNEQREDLIYWRNLYKNSDLWNNLIGTGATGSALLNLGHDCTLQSIPFINVDPRSERRKVDLVRTTALLTLKANNNNDWLGDYHRKEFKENQIAVEYNNDWLEDEIFMQFEKNQRTDTLMPLYKHFWILKNFYRKAIDIRILHALHDLIQSKNETLHLLIPYEQKKAWLENPVVKHQNTKNIFVFTGNGHIESVYNALKNHLHFASPFGDQKKFTKDRYGSTDALQKELKTKYSPSLSFLEEQPILQPFIDKYGVSISQFFFLESGFLEEQEPHYNSELGLWEYTTESNTAHAAILLKLYAIMSLREHREW